MQNLRSFILCCEKPVYVHLTTENLAKRFLCDAEEQGFLFSDGKKPTEKEISSFFAVHSDLTVNYIGANGRIAYQTNSNNISRLEYDIFLKGIYAE